MQHLDIDTLEAFIGVVETGSFTDAARRVGKSQAAVSSAIIRLERRLGQNLLNRTSRTVSLTPAGELLADAARRIISIEQEAIANLGGFGLQSRVRLGMPDDYIGLFGTIVMEHFSKRNNEFAVEVVCEFSHDLEQLVARGDIDLAIVSRSSGQETGELLRREPLIWCTSRHSNPELEDDLPLALFPENCRARPHILEALERVGRPYRVVWVSSHMQSVQSAVMMGFCVTALPHSALTFEHRRLGAEEGFPPLPNMELALISRTDLGIAGRKLAQFLLREFREPGLTQPGPKAGA